MTDRPGVTAVGSSLLAAAIFLPLTIVAVPSADLWWHLAIGRLVWNTHAIPLTDPWSFTVPGHPWQNDEWLFSSLIYPLYRLDGLQAVYILKSLVLLLAFVIVVRYAIQRSGGHPLVAIGTGFLCLCFSEYRFFFDIRPQLASYVFLPLCASLVWRYVESENPRWLWPLPGLVWLWANLHAAVLVGPALMAVTAAGLRGRLRSHLALACAVSIALIPLNLCGLDLVTYPFRLWHSLWSQHLNEWQPLWDTPGKHWLYLAFLGITLLNVTLFRRLFRPHELLVCWAFALLSLTGWRHIPLFCFLSVPLWAVVVTNRLPPPPPLPRLAWSLIAVASLVFIGVRLAAPDVPRQSGEAAWFPRYACDFLQANALGPHVFAPYGLGGYLIWRIAPPYQVFVDGRAVQVYPTAVYADYLAAAFEPARAAEVFNRYGVDTVLCFASPQVPEAGVRMMAGLSDWVPVYQDDLASVYVRKSARMKSLTYPPSPYRYRQQVQAELAGGHPDAARRLLLAALDLDDRDAQAAEMLGGLSFMQGDTVAGETWSRKALSWNPQLAEAWVNLAAAAANAGRKAEARQDVDQALSIDPSFEPARHLSNSLNK